MITTDVIAALQYGIHFYGIFDEVIPVIIVIAISARTLIGIII